MKVRVTQSDIARVAGVHNTTVSLALRNSRLIPLETRERIQSVAQSMGYAPDPALRALVAYRKSHRERRQVETLAYVTNGETRCGWRQLPAHERYFAAAQRRASELGYQLEHLWFGEAGMSQRRLDRLLLHRGISGVLLASQRTSCDDIAAINWSRLSAVKIGCFPQMPALNQVAVDPAGIVRLALRHILAEGFRRIGLVLPRQWDELADQSWSSAFHAELYRCSVKEAVPVLYLTDASEEPLPADAAVSGPASADASAVTRWYQRYKPEVIVSLTPAVLGHLRAGGLRVPVDVAYVDLFLQDTGSAIAGVWENCEKLGELAIEMLVSQLEQNSFGLPAVPTVTSISGVWRDGASLPSGVRAPHSLELPQSSPLKDNLVA